MRVNIHKAKGIADKDVTNVVIRIKALLINNDNIYIASEGSEYHFPGGHLEENESFEDCLKREVKEETGIVISDKDIIEPIYESIQYFKDNPRKGEVRRCETYYYVMKTNEKVNLNNINLTNEEKNGNFKIIELPISNVIDFLNDNISNHYMNKYIIPDMIEAIKEYLKCETK